MPDPLIKGFSRWADQISRALGHPVSFTAAAALVLVWLVSGPWFNFSDTWQLYANTFTTLVTFLMVFVLQHTQNRDGQAIQAKLDSLIACSPASNTLMGLDKATQEEIQEAREQIRQVPGQVRSPWGS